MRDVDADPFAVETLGCRDRGAATAEGVEDDVTFVRGSADDALQEGLRFLGRVAEPFTGLGIDGRDVRPYVLEGHARHLVEVAYVLRDAVAGIPYPPFVVQPLHGLGRRAPHAGYSLPLIFVPAAAQPGGRQIVRAVQPAVVRLVAIMSPYVFRVVALVLRIPRE